MSAECNPMIRMIVGRCHVSESNRAVILYAISRLRNGTTTFLRDMDKTERKSFMRQCVLTHSENRRLYTFAMKGGAQ